MAVRLHLVVCCIMALCHTGFASTILELIKQRPELSKMAALLQADTLFKLQLQRLPFTAFIPSDTAISNYEAEGNTIRPDDIDFVNGHLSNTPKKIQDLDDTVTSYTQGNPQLYVTKIPNGKPALTGYENYDYYINDAKVILANQMGESEGGHEQVLHIIDSVIAPTRPQGAATGQSGYPSAADVLANSRKYGLVDQKSISQFVDRVNALDQTQVFSSPGPNTFFIPVDDEFQTAQLLDKPVIHGHVVPGHTLFTTPASRQGKEHQSLAFSDNLKVMLKVDNVTVDNKTSYYAISNTVASDLQHPKGRALGRIVKSNIFVSNGVIHLIIRPLMTKVQSILSFLKEQGGPLSKFYELISEHQPKLLSAISSYDQAKPMTLFAPSNQAFVDVKQKSLNELALNSNKLGELLKLHMIPQRLTTDMIVDNSGGKTYPIVTLSQSRKIYFRVNDTDPSRQPTVSVEGAGVMCSIGIANIVAENGVIHIINCIMGIPSQSVQANLRTNPYTRIAYNISSQGGFNEQFNDKNKKFTMFVPNDEAWLQIKKEYASDYAKIIGGSYPLMSQAILQRHMIVGKELPIKALVAIINNGTLLPHEKEFNMTRGTIQFEAEVRESRDEYYVTWKGISARVVQPDVECVNGVIHIIDKVLMDRHDTMVSASPSVTVTSAISTALMLLVTALLR